MVNSTNNHFADAAASAFNGVVDGLIAKNLAQSVGASLKGAGVTSASESAANFVPNNGADLGQGR